MAAILIKGTTVHHWADIGDNRYSKEKTLQLMDEEVKFRICQADVLVIDEIGMISAEVFDKIEYLMRKVRVTDAVLGGLQVRILLKTVSPPPTSPIMIPVFLTFFLLHISNTVWWICIIIGIMCHMSTERKKIVKLTNTSSACLQKRMFLKTK